MLKVSGEQIERLKSVSDEKLEQEFIATLKTRAPAFLGMSDEDRFSNFISRTALDANDIGFESRSARDFYINLTLVCGTGVREDPQFAFLGLPDSVGYQSEIKLADKIHARLIRYMNTVLNIGTDRLATTIRSALSLEPTLAEISKPHALVTYIGTIWPERLEFIGEPLMYHAVHRSLKSTLSQEYSPARNALLVSIFGLRWEDNPLCAWLITSPDEQTDRMWNYASALETGAMER